MCSATRSVLAGGVYTAWAAAAVPPSDAKTFAGAAQAPQSGAPPRIDLAEWLAAGSW